MTHTGWGQPFDGHWCAANEARAAKALRQAGIWYGPKRPVPVKREAERGRLIAFNATVHRRLIRWTLQERAKRKPPAPAVMPVRNNLSQRIIELCAEAAGVCLGDFLGPRITRGSLVPARHVAAYLMKKHCHHLSLPQIGRKLGRRHHSTVHNALDQIAKDPARFADLIAYVEPRLPL